VVGLFQLGHSVMGAIFILNEQNHIITQSWDGRNLKCTFRRCVDRRVFQLWEDVVSITSAIESSEEEDETA
jgi:hypothetical protein